MKTVEWKITPVTLYRLSRHTLESDERGESGCTEEFGTFDSREHAEHVVRSLDNSFSTR